MAAYYLVHEGAHLMVALACGVFREVRFLGLGIQIDIYAEGMTELQLGVFCLAGAAATAAVGWLLAALAKRICRLDSRLVKAVMWYVTLALLLLDPLYLSVLCGFFGGGDMNGIRCLLPETAARIGFATIGVVHGVVIWKYLLPLYTKSFDREEK